MINNYIVRKICLLVLLFINGFSVFGQTVINKYTPVTAIQTPLCANSVITVASAADFSVGDKVLIIQMKGVQIDVSNTVGFGDVVDYLDAGNYEFSIIQAISGNQITLNTMLQRSYTVSGLVQLIRVPQYTDIIFNSPITCTAWNGTIGGVLVLEASGTVTLNSNIDVSSKGFLGGIVNNNAPGQMCDEQGYFFANNSYNGARKGEGVFELPVSMINGRGKNANGGGGGNSANAGGAGGGNYGLGGHGGRQWYSAGLCANLANGGEGGVALPYSTSINKIFMGGGGGGGQHNDYHATPGSNGGGIVIIISNAIVSNGGTIKSYANDCNYSADDGSGGGGAGGTVLLKTNTIVGNLTIDLHGGKGGDNRVHGTGGGGSGGVVWTSFPLPGNVSLNLSGGNPGYADELSSNYGATAGADGGVLVGWQIPGVVSPGINLGNDTTYCGAFTRVLEVDSASSILWSTGATTRSINVNSGGLYWVEVQNQCGTYRDSIVLSQNSTFSANIGNDTTLCVGDILILSDTITDATYLWNTNDTTSSINVISSGTYWLNVTKNACSAVDSINVTFVSVPQSFSLGNDTSYCGNFNRVLSVNTSDSILWNTGETTNSIVASTAGVYWAETYNQCGAYRDSITFSQLPLPNVQIGNDTVLCVGEMLTLLDTITSATYLWNTNATTSSINVTSGGLYWLSVTKNSCSAVDSINVSFISSPQPINIGNDTTYCGVFTRILSTNTVDSSFWSTGAITNSVAINAPGLYWVEVRNKCGAVQDSILISQNPIPPVNIGRDTILCNGNSLTLSDTISNASYLWNTNEISSSITVSSAGTYWLRVIKNGCEGRDSIVVNYVDTPASVFIGNDTTFCGPFSRILQVNTNNNVVWSTGQTGTGIVVNTEGEYLVRVYNVCGEVFDTILITQNPIPVLDLGSDIVSCYGMIVLLDATTASASYLWQDSSTGAVLAVDTPGQYSVSVTLDGCSARDSIRVDFVYPVSDTLVDTLKCANEVLRLGSGFPFASYEWSTGESDAVITVGNFGLYIQTITNACGESVISYDVSEKDCSCHVLFPTAFSPNGDGRNDNFGATYRCQLSNFQLLIFNRWGELVFSTTDIDERWDGFYKDRPQVLEVFTFSYQYTDLETNKKHFGSGNVTLVR